MPGIKNKYLLRRLCSCLFLLCIFFAFRSGIEGDVIYAQEESENSGCQIKIETAAPEAAGETLAVYKIGEAVETDQTVRFILAERYRDALDLKQIQLAEDVQKAIRILDRFPKEKITELVLDAQGKTALTAAPGVYLIEQSEFKSVKVQPALLAVPLLNPKGGYDNTVRLCMKTAPVTQPQTGDNQNILLYLWILLLSACAGGAAIIRRRK